MEEFLDDSWKNSLLLQPVSLLAGQAFTVAQRGGTVVVMICFGFCMEQQ